MDITLRRTVEESKAWILDLLSSVKPDLIFVCADGKEISTSKILISKRSRFLNTILCDHQQDDGITKIILPNVENSAVLETILKLPHSATFTSEELEDYHDILKMLEITIDYYDNEELDTDDDGEGDGNVLSLASFNFNGGNIEENDDDDFDADSCDESFTLTGILDDSNEEEEDSMEKIENKSEMTAEWLQNSRINSRPIKTYKNRNRIKKQQNKSEKTAEWLPTSTSRPKKVPNYNFDFYPCMFCCHTATNIANLKSHLSGVHFAQELLQDGGCENGRVCIFCDREFGQPSLLVRHLGCAHDMLPNDVKNKLRKFMKRKSGLPKKQEVCGVSVVPIKLALPDKK